MFTWLGISFMRKGTRSCRYLYVGKNVGSGEIKALKVSYVRFEFLRGENEVLSMEIQGNFKYLRFIQTPFRLSQILS